MPPPPAVGTDYSTDALPCLHSDAPPFLSALVDASDALQMRLTTARSSQRVRKRDTLTLRAVPHVNGVIVSFYKRFVNLHLLYTTYIILNTISGAPHQEGGTFCETVVFLSLLSGRLTLWSSDRLSMYLLCLLLVYFSMAISQILLNPISLFSPSP